VTLSHFFSISLHCASMLAFILARACKWSHVTATQPQPPTYLRYLPLKIFLQLPLHGASLVLTLRSHGVKV
jgi:hypothetical protein